MADNTLEIQIRVNLDGEEGKIAARLEQVLNDAVKGLGKTIGDGFVDGIGEAKKAAKGLDDIFGESVTKNLQGAFEKLETRLSDLKSGGEGVRRSMAEGFDPAVLDSFNSAMEQIIRLQDQIAEGGGDPASLKQLDQLTKNAGDALRAVRTTFQQSSLAARESYTSQSRSFNQESRERIAQMMAEKSKMVVETQAAAARIAAGSSHMPPKWPNPPAAFSSTPTQA